MIRKIILKTILYQFLSTFRINIVDCSGPPLFKKKKGKEKPFQSKTFWMKTIKLTNTYVFEKLKI